MNTITTGDGKVIDLDTLQIVGREEGSVAEAPPRQSKQELPSSALDTINQLSWGFNAGLFALPDSAQRAVGHGLGMKDDEIFQFTRLFNKGERAPENMVDRFARAISEGIGGGLPFTGTLAWAAKARPLTAVAETAPGILKGIANEAIQFVQKNPGLAAATDIAFGAAYEGIRQTVEESVSDDNPNKKYYTEFMPMAAFMGIPAAMQISPTRGIAKWVGNKVNGIIPEKADLSQAKQEAIDSLGGIYKLPIIKIVPRMLLGNVEKKLAAVFGPISETPEAQRALADLAEHLSNPEVARLFIVDGKPTLDYAEQTLFPAVMGDKMKVLETLPPQELEPLKQRVSRNLNNLHELYQSFAPEARQSIQEAFQAAQAERQSFFEGLAKQRGDLTEAEIASLSERLGPQDINNLNAEIRGAIVSNIEMSDARKGSILRKMGMTEGMAEDGTLLSTRDKETGLYSMFPSQDMESHAQQLIDKYYIKRPTKEVVIPEPIRLLKRFVDKQTAAREKMENDMLSQLVDNHVESQIADMGFLGDPELIKIAKNAARQAVGGATEKATKGRSSQGFLGISELKPSASNLDSEGNASISMGRAVIKINPAQIQADAKRIAEESVKIDLNLPEALDLLASAQKTQTRFLTAYDNALSGGRVRETDARVLKSTGESVFNEIEDLVLNTVPKIKENYGQLKDIFNHSRDVYQKTLPLLASKKAHGLDEYLVSNEKIMQRAFDSAEHLTQLQTLLQNSPQAGDFLMRGTIDWLRNKGAVGTNGLVDPKKIRSILDKNQNIVNVLPQDIRTKLQDEVGLADAYVTRLGELDKREVAAKDAELTSLLNKAARPSADPRQALATALKDPATMHKLVGQMGNDPKMLAALRRSVWDVATEGAKTAVTNEAGKVQYGNLKSFIDNNESSLKILFKDTDHLKNLKMLADMQRRVTAFAGVTGNIPLFETIDAQLKRTLGFGVQFATTTAREGLTGRISPESALLAFMLRFVSSTENQLYSRLFTKALEDPSFAQSITHISTPEQGKKAAAKLEGIGISLKTLFNDPLAATSPKIAQQSLRQELPHEQLQDQQTRIGNMKDLPVVPRGTSAQQMLKALPPAPATRGLGQEAGYRFPIAPPGPPPSGVGQIPLMYPAMFPHDPISGLLQQRQAQIQSGQQVMPGQ